MPLLVKPNFYGTQFFASAAVRVEGLSDLGFARERRLAGPKHDPKRTPLDDGPRGPSRSQLARADRKGRA